MINLYNADGEVIRTFDKVIRWDSRSVEWDNGGYRAKVYAGPGEYFDDPDNPLPPEPEVLPSEDAVELLNIIKGVIE